MNWKKKNKFLYGNRGLGFLIAFLVIIILVWILISYFKPDFFQAEESPSQAVLNEQVEESDIVEGIHVETGLIAGEGLTAVINNCTNCHSAKLVTQNRATKEGWTQVIRWMQETQNLWDLGENEAVIVSYLSTHYAPEPRGRRKPLEVEWYDLK